MLTDDDILPMGVGDTNFAVHRASRDVRPMAWLRELTQNAIEAVLKTVKPGRVTWRTVRLDHYDAPKLAVEDTGCGMSRDEILKYINNLYSSGGTQDLHGNYGVGAKLAGASVSPAGLEYFTFDDPEKPGCFAVLVGGETYGLKKIQGEDGDYRAIEEVPNTPENRFALLREAKALTGTQVVLVGEKVEDDWSVRAKWGRSLAQTLMRRYFVVPEAIDLRVEFATSEASAESGVNHAHIKGHKFFLDEYSEPENRGTLALSDATAYWWILKEAAPRGTHGFARGHIASLYQNEMYDFLTHETSPSGRKELGEFGIYIGWQRVVIYVEPRGETYYPDGARARLLHGGQDLPWARWATEFRANMPDALRRFVESQSECGRTNHAEAVARYLAELYPDHRLPAYRRGDEATPAGSATTAPPAGRRRGEGTSERGGGAGTGRRRDRFFDRGNRDQPHGNPTEARLFPERVWVTEADGSRADGELEDLAAEYVPGSNVIKISRDFRGWHSFIEESVSAAHDEAAEPIVRNLCEFVWELLLTNVVASANQLRGSPHWTPEQIQEAVSPRALTLAVVDRIARGAVLRHHTRGQGISLS